MYKCRIIKPDEFSPHSNADRLKLLVYNGMQFIVGVDADETALYAVFFDGGQLSHEYCHENNLYRHPELNKDPLKKGYFDDNRKVRAQKLRGEVSYGYVATLDSFEFAGKFDFRQGIEFDEINGHGICQKYITRKTREKMERNTKKSRSDVIWNLEKHYDTENIKFYLDRLPENVLSIITEKMHGTSGRTGYVNVVRETQNIFQRLLSRLRRRKFYSVTEGYELVSGTRNTIVNTRPDVTSPGTPDYYRWEIHEQFKGLLRKGETIYYEVVGYDSLNSPIMNTHDTTKLDDKDFTKKYGKQIVYNYGCGEGSNPLRELYVYRITQETANDDTIDLPWSDVKARCNDLSLKHVPEMFVGYIRENSRNRIEHWIEALLCNGQSDVGTNLMEGVCFRFEGTGFTKVYKAKNLYFLILEGVLKDREEYVDAEEAN